MDIVVNINGVILLPHALSHVFELIFLWCFISKKIQLRSYTPLSSLTLNDVEAGYPGKIINTPFQGREGIMFVFLGELFQNNTVCPI